MRASSLLPRLQAALDDRYMVERDLCAGGMSLIYLAQDRSSGRRVVVKVLRPDLALLLGPERFQREIRVTERLHHPNIVPLEHSGDADGLLYYVMPLIEGESLRARLKESGPLAVEETIRTGSEVAEALNHAHAEGFVHRDLKPDNILFARHGAMLADFGLARLRTAGSSDLSSEGIAIGTPEYMSPEQGAAKRVDGRSDIYSLACVLYEALAGRPPFTGATPQIVLARHATESPPPIGVVRPDVPSRLVCALDAALAKRPKRRPSTGKAFARLLEASLEPNA
jgi:serine/threonine-protein kinase